MSAEFESVRKLYPQRVTDETEHRVPPDSLSGLQQYFIDLYGARNNIWLPGRLPRINLLSVGLGDLQDAIRKESDPEHLGKMFARIPPRIFCIAHGVNNIPIATSMAEKYPASGCAYCHNNPCSCQERRPDIDPEALKVTNRSQLGWRLSDWQSHLDQLYGSKNKAKGIENIMNRLYKEVAEVLNFEHTFTTKPNITRIEVEHEYGLELADCLAWTVAAANIMDVDLEEQVVKRFHPVCWNCGTFPCRGCGPFSFAQVEG